MLPKKSMHKINEQCNIDQIFTFHTLKALVRCYCIWEEKPSVTLALYRWNLQHSSGKNKSYARPGLYE